MGRPKGSKNKQTKKDKQSNKVYPVRLYIDLQEWVDAKPNKNEYINGIIRKDMLESMNNNINKLEE